MAVIVYSIIGLLLVLLQVTVLMVHPLWPAAPDIYFVLLGYLAFSMNMERAAIILLPVVWLLETLSWSVPGYYIVLCYGGLSALKICDARYQVTQTASRIGLVGATYLLLTGILYFIMAISWPERELNWSWPLVFLRVMLIVVIAVPCFSLFTRLDRIMVKNSMEKHFNRQRAGNYYR